MRKAIGKTIQILFGVLLLLVFAPAGLSEDAADEPAGLTHFLFVRAGDMRPESWEVFAFPDSVYLCRNDGQAQAVDPLLLRSLELVLIENGIPDWDGFSGYNPDVLDGQSFDLLAEYADGRSVEASGDNAFPPGYFAAMDQILTVLDTEESEGTVSDVSGTYRYEGEGFWDPFRIRIMEDGTYTFYEGMLSSYIGQGTWTMEGARLRLDEKGGMDISITFLRTGNSLVFLEEESDNFLYVKVRDGERFLREDEEKEVQTWPSAN